MIKAGFVGFGEVNTPKDIIVKKCRDALENFEKQGVSAVSVYPVTDDYEEKDIAHALDVLKKEDFDCLVLCIAGWIPTHAVIKIAEHYRHKPMVLWGLCGWMEDGRLVTTAIRPERARCAKPCAILDTISSTYMILSDFRRRQTAWQRIAGQRRLRTGSAMPE